MPEEPSIPHVGKPAPEGATPPAEKDSPGGKAPAGSEVTGHSGIRLVVCATCGLTYYIPRGWEWFTCANGHLNYL